MSTPSQEYAPSRFRRPPRPFKGLDARVNALHGAWRRRPRVRRDLREEAERIEALEPEWSELSEIALRNRLFELRQGFRRDGGKVEDEVLRSALAGLREASKRRMAQRPYLVQLMGALALHRGFLTEMATGEGKTLTAGLAAVLAGWSGRPCHVLTVNDYLVRRDADWLSPLYNFCGIRTNWVTDGMEPKRRREGYAADVTYATAKEVLGDFLRDRLQAGLLQDPPRRLIRRLLRRREPPGGGFVLRGLHTAIVDEADSILIDEAVTPLIISSSRRNEALVEASRTAARIAKGFQPDVDYRTNARYKEVEFTAMGFEKLDRVRHDFSGLWRGPSRSEELLTLALQAREFYEHGKQYIIVDGKIVIVDEFTGRPMARRSWQQGVHQAVEAKEGLEISDPTETVARRSFQRFFRCYEKLSGMTGTASEASGEFWQVYGLPVVTIPTNRPCRRAVAPDRAFASAKSKWDAIVAEIVRVHATGRPVLVGTRSVVASEDLAERLAEQGLTFKILNATRLREEAEIIRDAGQSGTITIATNMAGRGTDIRLGQGVDALGGLHVIATERHESGRIDRQLFGRCARQGDPGSSQAFLSLEDEIVRRYLSRAERRILASAASGSPALFERLASAAVTRAQHKAESVAAKQRRALLRTDLWLEDALSFAGGPDAAI